MFDNFSSTSAFGLLVMLLGGLSAALTAINPEAAAPIEGITEGVELIRVNGTALWAMFGGFVVNLLRWRTLADGALGFLGKRS